MRKKSIALPHGNAGKKFAALMASAVLLAGISVGASAEEAGPLSLSYKDSSGNVQTTSCADVSSLSTALDGLSDASDIKVTLNGDVTTQTTWKITKDCTIDLNGHTYTFDNSNSEEMKSDGTKVQPDAIDISSNVVLNDSTGNGGIYYKEAVFEYEGFGTVAYGNTKVVTVTGNGNATGSLTINSGTISVGDEIVQYGVGLSEVLQVRENAKFTMNGGKLVGMNYFYGSSVSMSGGEISGTSSSGNVFFLAGSDFTMTGGTITNPYIGIVWDPTDETDTLSLTGGTVNGGTYALSLEDFEKAAATIGGDVKLNATGDNTERNAAIYCGKSGKNESTKVTVQDNAALSGYYAISDRSHANGCVRVNLNGGRLKYTAQAFCPNASIVQYGEGLGLSNTADSDGYYPVKAAETVSRSKLNALLSKTRSAYQSGNAQGLWKAASWTAFKTAYENAQAVSDEKVEANQNEIDYYANALKEAQLTSDDYASKYKGETFGGSEVKLQAGTYKVPVALQNAGNHNNASAGESCVAGKATLVVAKDGTAKLTVPLQTVTVGTITNWAYGWKYCVSQDQNDEWKDCETTTTEDGNVNSITFPIGDNSWDGVYVSLCAEAMGGDAERKEAWLRIDYTDAKSENDTTETVTGTAQVKHDNGEYNVNVSVTCDDGKIIEVSAAADGISGSKASENQIHFNQAAEGMADSFTGKSATDADDVYDVDTVTGATYSSKAIRSAVMNALNLEEPEEKITLKDGTYKVPVSMMQTNKDEESMGNAVISKNAIVTVKDGKATYDISFTGLNREYGGQKLYGHVIKMSTYPAGTTAENIASATFTEATVVKTVEDTGLKGTKETFPYTWRFTRDTADEDTIFVNVTVDAVADYPQDARLVFDYSKAVTYDASSEKDDDSKKSDDNKKNDNKNNTTKTVGRKAEKFVVAGNTYKLTSVGKNPTASLVKASAKKAKLTIPASVKKNGFTVKVTAIASGAFKNNKKVKTVVIGKNVKTIGNKAFYGCKKLKAVTIGKGVKTIGKQAFMNCKNLKKITVKSTQVKTVGKNAFKNINKKAVIKVPKKKYKKYSKLFKNKGQKKTVKIKK